MTTQIIAKIASNTYNLTDSSNTFFLAMDGLAIPRITRLEEQGPLQNGATDLGFRLEPRDFLLTLGMTNNSLSGLFNKRKLLDNIFKPLATTPIKLLFQLDNGDQRQLDCYLAGSLKMDDSDKQGYFQKTAITLRAADPTFYDPALTSINYGITTGGGAGSVPAAVPLIVGSASVNQTVNVGYFGTWPVNPIIVIQGPITDPIITNLTTNEKIDLTGAILTSADTYNIDTRYGYKTIKDQNGANKISLLSKDSNLVSFHLDIDPVAAGGSNNIKVTGSTAGNNTQVYLQFNTRFIGI